MDKLKVVLDWFPNTNHAGYLVAQKKGWFAENDLEVSFEAVVHSIMDMHGADFICGPMLSMLGNRMRGIEITGIATITQRCDSGVLSLKSAGITRPRDLTGKRLTYWMQPWYHLVMGSLVNGDGGAYDQVELIHKNVGDILTTLTTEADATWVYAAWENEVIRDAGYEFNFFNICDYDPVFDFPAPSMAATKEILAERPDAVRRFLSALDRGYQYAAKHPEETADLIWADMPEGSTLPMLTKSLQHLSPLFLNETGHWGRIRPERWNAMADWLIEKGFYDHRRPDEFTNEYFV